MSWNQPNANNQNEILVDENYIESAYNSYYYDSDSIRKLNEDCLRHIFSFLPITDKFMIERGMNCYHYYF